MSSNNSTPTDSKMRRSHTADNRSEIYQQALCKKPDTDLKLFVSESFTPSHVNQLTRYKIEHSEQDRQDDELIKSVISPPNKSTTFLKQTNYSRLEDPLAENSKKTPQNLSDKQVNI